MHGSQLPLACCRMRPEPELLQEALTHRGGAGSIRLAAARTNQSVLITAFNEQVVGCDAREFARVSLYFLQPATRVDPKAIQSHERPAGRERGTMRRGFKMRMQPAQGTSPQEPLIRIAQQDINIRETNVEQLEKLAHLLTALARHRPQMCCHHLHTPPVAIEGDIDRPAGFVSPAGSDPRALRPG